MMSQLLQMTHPLSLHFRDFIKYIYFYFRRVLGRLTLADVCTAQMAWGGRYHLSSVRERESFQQHLTLRLTHNFIVPMNVLMRQNVFDKGKKKILAGIYELFTGPENLAFSGHAIGKQHSQKQHGAWQPCCVMHVTYSELSLKLVICGFVPGIIFPRTVT